MVWVRLDGVRVPLGWTITRGRRVMRILQRDFRIQAVRIGTVAFCPHDIQFSRFCLDCGRFFRKTRFTEEVDPQDDPELAREPADDDPPPQPAELRRRTDHDV